VSAQLKVDEIKVLAERSQNPQSFQYCFGPTDPSEGASRRRDAQTSSPPDSMLTVLTQTPPSLTNRAFTRADDGTFAVTPGSLSLVGAETKPQRR
jgi:hypothetical protein